MSKYDPAKFEMLMSRYYALHDHESDYARDLLAKALTCAPPDIAAAMHNKMIELDLLPPVLFVDDAGNPMFTIQQVADKLGVPIKEVEQRMKEMVKEEPEQFAPVGNIHRLH
ncbi:MAG: hypothetical protein CXR31_09740 [Geobacter sp.]|nr:MAG: hypothetical protein CXR31_09740 [Geobacter sp.]